MNAFEKTIPSYTFQFCVMREDETILNIGITDKDTRKMKQDISRLLKRYVPDPSPEDCPSESSAEAPEDEAPPTRTPFKGGVGLLTLHCPECGDTFVAFVQKPRSSYTCRCGHAIDLTTPLAVYRCHCQQCGRSVYGKTNLEAPEIAVKCKCDNTIPLRWDQAEREYRSGDEDA